MSNESGVKSESEAPRILVVDDEDAIASALATLLEQHGCDVVTAWSADTALAAAEAAEPAVALLDIVLPGTDGLKLAGQVKARWPSCEIVMITGQSSVDSVVEAMHRGAFDYLAKPFRSIEDVWTAVERALAKRSSWISRRAALERARVEREAQVRPTESGKKRP